MAISDPIADLLTRIRNAIRAQHRFLDVPWSRMNESIVDILKGLGFIEQYLVKRTPAGRGTVRVFLKYRHGLRPVIRGLKRVSKPGLRRYVRSAEIPSYFGGYGESIISTSKGVMSGREAREKRVGGELLCLVW